jgi:hypothetical protein
MQQGKPESSVGSQCIGKDFRAVLRLPVKNAFFTYLF